MTTKTSTSSLGSLDEKQEGAIFEESAPKALAALEDVLSAYRREVIEEATKIASRRGADMMCAAFIIEAGKHLSWARRHQPKRDVAITVGGVFLGTALSNTLGSVIPDEARLLGSATTLALLALGVVGSFLIAWNLRRHD